jgi:hypothetical protein
MKRMAVSSRGGSWVGFLLPLAVGLLTSVACDHSNSGAADASAADASAADASVTLELPACLRDLIAPCPTTGACRFQGDDAGTSRMSCYSSGVRTEDRQSLHLSAEVGCQTLYTQKVFKADGTLCYTSAYFMDAGLCESTHYTWTDAADQVVATGLYGSTGLSITCETSDESLSCTGSVASRCPEVPAQHPFFSLCEAGACP